MIREIVAGGIILINAGLCVGQQAPVASRESSRQGGEFALQQLPEQIKRMDEAAVRLLLRVRLAAYLWDKNLNPSPSASSNAEAIVTEAVADFKTHEDEIPTLYSSRLRSDLIALLQQRAPDLLKRLNEQYEFLANDSRSRLRGAQLMLNDKAGVKPAIELARAILSSGDDPGPALLFFLQQLQQEKPSEITGLLSTLLAAEEQKPGSISISTLFWISSYYLKEESPQELKVRFLAAVVNALEMGQDWADNHLLLAYRLLNTITPVALKLAPSLYQRIRALSSAASARLPQSVLSRMAAENRIKGSTDRLNQLVIEAAATSDASFKDELLSQAAQLALTKKQFKMAADLAAQTSSDGDQGIWRDQFLSDVARDTLEHKDSSLAEEIAPKIKSRLDRAATFQKIALYFHALKNIARARELLNDAANLIESTENGAQKVRHLLSLISAFIKVDELRVPEIAQAAVKVINRISTPPAGEELNSERRKAHTQSLMQIAWNVIPAFERMAPRDELGTFSLANGIQSKEIRASAILGASIGIIKASKSADAKMPDK